ncbi:hypothetical protein TRFO_31712 [Tritrichomonas foetus]|uniref:BEACH domain-containing protein n=1 Tax=Tritrichomonas foetus TaxID=1144522 RepID=A0A1J4JRS2_9EUKA|nr:hypothetical protein TRFO_31712 [Tritrichomonas foetus]|eukprot:OHT01450.1 hypothetical protein TRFO_31712 [Tritrichomonas foetus]
MTFLDSEPTEKLLETIRMINDLNHNSGSNKTYESNLANSHIPNITSQIFSNLTAISGNSASFLKCCNYLANYLHFDSLFVEKLLIDKKYSFQNKLALLANSIAWIGSSSEEIKTDDNFCLVVKALFSQISDADNNVNTNHNLNSASANTANTNNINNYIKFWIFMTVDYFTHIINVSISLSTISTIANLASSMTPDSFDFSISILISLLNYSLDASKSDEQEILIRSINNFLIISKNVSIPESTFLEILSLCAPKINELNFDAISLLSTISDIFTNTYIMNIFSSLSTIARDRLIHNHCEKFGTFGDQFFHSTSNLKFLTISNGDENLLNGDFSFDTFHSFPHKLFPLTSDDFDPQTKITDLLSEEQFKLFNIFQSLLHRKSQEIPVSFFLSFSDIIAQSFFTPYFLDLYVFLLSILNTFPEFDLPVQILDIIVNSPVFSPSFCLFTDNDSFIAMNALRNLTFRVIMANWPDKIIDILQFNKEDPYLLTEHIARIFYAVSYESTSYFIADETIVDISNTMRYFINVISLHQSSPNSNSHVNPINSSSKNDNSIPFRAFSTLAIVVLRLMEDFNTANIAFSSNEFTDSFLSLVFCKSIRPTVGKIFRIYLSSSKCLTSTIALNNIAQYVTEFFTHIKEICLSKDSLTNENPLPSEIQSFSSEIDGESSGDLNISRAYNQENEEVYSLQSKINAAIDFFSAFEEALNHNMDVVSHFISTVPAIISFFIAFPSQESMRLVISFLSIFSIKIDDSNLLSFDEIVLLGKQIRETEPDGVTESTCSKLLTLMTGNKSASISNVSFMIKNPAFAHLFLNASYNNLALAIQIFLKLCEFSIFNCIQCQRGKLDIFLIKLMKNFPNKFKFLNIEYEPNLTEDEMKNLVLPLIMKIFENRCCPSSLENFFSLAVPSFNNTNNDTFNNTSNQLNNQTFDFCFPELANTVIDNAIALTTFTPSKPQIQYTFHPQCEKVTQTTSFSSPDFTYAFSLMIDQPASLNNSPYAIIFRLEDDYKMLSLYVNGRSIICEVKMESGISSAPLFSEIPPCKFIFYSLTVKDINDAFKITFTIGKDRTYLFTVKNPHFDLNNLKVSIGGFKESYFICSNNTNSNQQSSFNNSAPSSQPGSLNQSNPFITATSSFEEIPKRHDIDNHIFCFLGNTFLFDKEITPKEYVHLYATGNSDLENKITMTVTNQCGYLQNFISVIQRYQLGSVLLPFFKYADKAPLHFIEKLVDLFNAIKQDQDFEIIPLYLKKCSNSVLTYSLYIRFFTLFTNCTTETIFRHLLFNFDLWTLAQPSQLLRIVKHWATVLLPAYPKLFRQWLSFTSIIINIRIYFYFTFDDSKIINNVSNRDHGEENEKSNEKIEIEQCRVYMNKLLYQHASQQLKRDDVLSLVSHCITCTNIKQKCSFLDLLCDISGYAKTIENMDDISLKLHPLFINTDPTIFVRTMKAVLLLSSPQQIEYIIDYTNKITVTQELFNLVMNYTDELPEVLILACKLAFNLRCEKLLLEKMSSIVINPKNSSRIALVKSWYFWPLMLSSVADKRDEAVVMFIISKILESKFETSTADNIFCFLDLISINLNVPVFNLKVKLLNHLCNFALGKYEIITDIINICGRYLLFTSDVQPHSDALLSMFENSPFSGENSQNNSICCQTNKKLDIFDERRINKTHLIFHINIENEASPAFHSLVAHVIKLYNMLEVPDITLKNYASIFIYLSQKDLFDDTMKWEKGQSFDLSIRPYVQVLNLSFSSFILKVTKSLSSYIQSIQKSADNLLVLHPNIVDISMNDIEAAQYAKTLENIRLENKLLEFESQFMNSSSIWKSKKKNRITCQTHVNDQSYKMKFRNFINHDFQRPCVDCVNSNKNRLKCQEIFKQYPQNSYAFEVKQIKFSSQIHSIFVISHSNIAIYNNYNNYLIPFKKVRYILLRMNSILEIIVNTGKSYVLDFEKSTRLTDALNILKQQVFPQGTIVQRVPADQFVLQFSFTEDWINGKITNYQYILLLNYFGGRSYNIPSLYPIFPQIRNFDQPCRINPQIWLRKLPIYSSNFSDSNHDSSDENDFLLLYSQNEFELIPEFYSNPEVFDGIIPNNFAFVYELRRLLESEKVTLSLHKWIDKTFGVENDQKVQRIFYDRHPPRINGSIKSKNIIRTLRSVQLEMTDILVASISINCNNGMVSIRILTKNGQFIEYFINFHHRYSHGSNSIIENHKTPPKENTPPIISSLNMNDNVGSANAAHIPGFHPEVIKQTQNIQLDINNCFPVPISASGIVLINNIDSEITVLKNGIINKMKMSPFHCDFAYIDHNDMNCSLSNTIFCCSSEGSAFSMRLSDASITGICHVSSESPTCITASKKFDVIAVGVFNGKILLFDIHNCKFKRSLNLAHNDLNVSPRKLLITNSLGFIVAEYRNKLFVFSINGAKISEQEIDFDIQSWHCATTEKGFDFIFLVDVIGRIYMFEAFNLNQIKIICQLESPAITIKYSRSLGGIIAIIQTCKAVFLPFELK